MLVTVLRQWQLRAETGFNDNSLTTLVVRSADPVLHPLLFLRLLEGTVLTIDMALCTLFGNRLLRLLGIGHRSLRCWCALPDRRSSSRFAVVGTSGQRCDRACA